MITKNQFNLALTGISLGYLTFGAVFWEFAGIWGLLNGYGIVLIIALIMRISKNE